MNIFSKGFRFIKRKIAQIIYFFIRDSFDEFAGNSAVLQNIQELQRIVSEAVNEDRFKIIDNRKRINENTEGIDENKKGIDDDHEKIAYLEGVVRAVNEDLDARATRIQEFAEAINTKLSNVGEFVNYSPDKLDLQQKMRGIPGVNYVEFENKYRGEENVVKEKQSAFLSFFEKCTNVLDIGCGRGEFLEIMQEKGIHATGIDIDEGMVNRCKEKGLDVTEVDALEFLDTLNEKEVDGVFCSQVVEHFSYREIQWMLYTLSKKLRKEAVVLFETVNSRCLPALQMFYLDMTHVQPVDFEALLYSAENCEFRHSSVVLSSPVDEKLDPITQNLDYIDQYRDYALIINKK